MPKILIVEDDPVVQMTLVDWLSSEKHLVETTASGADALQMMTAFEYDLVVLDWMLPEMSGVDILRSYRSNGGDAQVILLTGKDDLFSKTTGLDLGADDYLTKPVQLPELSSRIRACLRRRGTFQPFRVTVGNVHLDADKRLVTLNGERIFLTTKEFTVLEFLMRHPKEVFGSRALLERLWPSDSEISENTVGVCVKSLRAKIGKGDNCILKTILGSGYTVDGDS
jgi:DNA-binding response OmpR family regulator